MNEEAIHISMVAVNCDRFNLALGRLLGGGGGGRWTPPSYHPKKPAQARFNY